jgi:uncharacterized LabA/DUF88 family protein
MTKVGVYVDVENIRRCGGYGMQYDVLRQYACRDGADPMRLNAYVGFDRHRAHRDKRYERTSRNFFSTIRDYGFKVIEKEVKWLRDDDGNRYAKANADLDMAVDALLQSKNLDRVILVTGDGDFVQVVRALQNFGCRVEAVAFDNVAVDLRREVDQFMSGFMIPNLLPTGDKDSSWGDIGSRVRGICYYYKQEERFGFLRFLSRISSLWITDSREAASPYQTAYCNDSQFVNFSEFNALPSRTLVFEFTLAESDKFEGQYQAKDILLTSNF